MLKTGIKSVKFGSQLISLVALRVTSDEVSLKVIRFRVSGQPILDYRPYSRPIGPLWMAKGGGIKL